MFRRVKRGSAMALNFEFVKRRSTVGKCGSCHVSFDLTALAPRQEIWCRMFRRVKRGSAMALNFEFVKCQSTTEKCGSCHVSFVSSKLKCKQYLQRPSKSVWGSVLPLSWFPKWISTCNLHFGVSIPPTAPCHTPLCLKQRRWKQRKRRQTQMYIAYGQPKNVAFAKSMSKTNGPRPRPLHLWTPHAVLVEGKAPSCHALFYYLDLLGTKLPSRAEGFYPSCRKATESCIQGRSCACTDWVSGGCGFNKGTPKKSVGQIGRSGCRKLPKILPFLRQLWAQHHMAKVLPNTGARVCALGRPGSADGQRVFLGFCTAAIQSVNRRTPKC